MALIKMVRFIICCTIVLAMTCPILADPFAENEQELEGILYASTGSPRVEPQKFLGILKSLEAIYSAKTDPESTQELDQIKKFIEVSKVDNYNCISSMAEDLNNMIKRHNSNQSYHMNLANYLVSCRDQQLALCERVMLEPEIMLASEDFKKEDQGHLEALHKAIVKMRGRAINAPYFDVNSDEFFRGIYFFMRLNLRGGSYEQFDRSIVNSCNKLKKTSLYNFKLYNLTESNMFKLKEGNLNWLTHVHICKRVLLNYHGIKEKFKNRFRDSIKTSRLAYDGY